MRDRGSTTLPHIFHISPWIVFSSRKLYMKKNTTNDYKPYDITVTPIFFLFTKTFLTIPYFGV